MTATTVWLVIAHGSRNPALVEAHGQICAAIADRVGEEAAIRPAYLEITEPSIPDAIDEAVASGATTVVLVPYFLHVGNHTLRDLPQILDDAGDRHHGVEIVLADHLGIDDRLVDLAIDRARGATAGGGDER
ncbi:MAG: CbiX/SirB N-terminal domain-containing protein [Acidimicrobiales bacterium]|nr:CbiX/SirB N-terminal domain-containing protein [Acidimicrobiales bacterium]